MATDAGHGTSANGVVSPFAAASVRIRIPEEQEDVETEALLQDESPVSSPAEPRRANGNEFTLRAILAGTAIGSLLCFSNMYFGLQTGWITMGSLQSAVLGFGLFKFLQRFGKAKDFTVAENVIVQTTAVATATMPLAAGLVGIIPAFNKLTPEENPPYGAVHLDMGQLTLWTTALAFFGVFIAVPLRTQTIIREKLRFPSGTATANVIKTLFGVPADEAPEAVAAMRAVSRHVDQDTVFLASEEERVLPPARKLSCVCSNALDKPLLDCESATSLARADMSCTLSTWHALEAVRHDKKAVTDWETPWRVLMWTFAMASLYSLAAGQLPFLTRFPVLSWLGFPAATAWGWELSPALGYVGQGMIMGPRTACSMLLGALLGYSVLGPYARSKGWAPGPIGDWRTGATGWVVWVSLAIMLGDSITSLGLLIFTSLQNSWHNRGGSSAAAEGELKKCDTIPTSWWVAGLAASSALCTGVLAPMFHLPWWQPLVAVLLALLVAVLAVRALGETDLNPVSGVGKLSQAIFAVISPGKVLPNLVAGAIAEAGAQQAGDMMQDFKTAHLLGVCPRQQFGAMLIGSATSIFVSVAAFKLYTSAYQVPGPEFPAPTAEIWLDMAKLVNGGMLPAHVLKFCFVAAALAALLPAFRFVCEWLGVDCDSEQQANCAKWTCRVQSLLPSGIGIAVGMYVSPRWTLPRVIGAIVELTWRYVSPGSHSSSMVVLASGLVLGEGTASIITAVCKALLRA